MYSEAFRVLINYIHVFPCWDFSEALVHVLEIERKAGRAC